MLILPHSIKHCNLLPTVYLPVACFYLPSGRLPERLLRRHHTKSSLFVVPPLEAFVCSSSSPVNSFNSSSLLFEDGWCHLRLILLPTGYPPGLRVTLIIFSLVILTTFADFPKRSSLLTIHSWSLRFAHPLGRGLRATPALDAPYASSYR